MTKKIKVLNLYAGIGGNRKLWENVEVTAVEHNEEVANCYKHFFPNDKVIVGCAKEYLINHYKEFDFIWASPPCQSHSRVRFMATKCDSKYAGFDAILPDMSLWQLIIFLDKYVSVPFIVENVRIYYDFEYKPLKEQLIGSHYYWSNYKIPVKNQKESRCHNGSTLEKQERKGFDISNFQFKTIRKDQVLRNCVEPEMGLYVFDCAFKKKQLNLDNKQWEEIKTKYTER